MAVPPSHPGNHSASAAISSSVMLPGLVEREPGLDLRVGEHRVVDEVAVLVQRGADGELLGVDGGARVRRALRWKRVDRDRVDPQSVDDGRDLDAGIGGKVGTGPPCPPGRMVHDVGDDPGRVAGRHRVDDHRGVLAAALDLERLAGLEPALGVLVLLEVVGDPREVLPDRDVEPLDEVPWG